MKSIGREELQLRRDLLSERGNLSGLVKETEYVIGQVAKHGYDELNKLPVQEPFYPHWRPVIRTVAVPNDRLAVPNNDTFAIAKTSTLTSKHTNLIGVPRVSRMVEVEVVDPNMEQLYVNNPRFTVGAKGSVLFDYRNTYTHPNKTVANPRSPFYTYDSRQNDYSSVEDLRDTYASAYSGALAVTGLVAASLEVAHGIESDTGSLSTLLEAWQNVRASEYGAVAPSLVEYLPRDWAEQAGASF